MCQSALQQGGLTNDHKTYFKLWHVIRNHLGHAWGLWTWPGTLRSPYMLTYSRKQWFKPLKILSCKKKNPASSLHRLHKPGSILLREKYVWSGQNQHNSNQFLKEQTHDKPGLLVTRKEAGFLLECFMTGPFIGREEVWVKLPGEESGWE